MKTLLCSDNKIKYTLTIYSREGALINTFLHLNSRLEAVQLFETYYNEVEYDITIQKEGQE